MPVGAIRECLIFGSRAHKQKQEPLMSQCVSGFALGPLNRIFLLPINGNSIWVLDRERSVTAAGKGIDESKGRGGLVMPQAEASFCCSGVEARLHFKLVHSHTQNPTYIHTRTHTYVHVGSMADPSFFSASLFLVLLV